MNKNLKFFTIFMVLLLLLLLLLFLMIYEIKKGDKNTSDNVNVTADANESIADILKKYDIELTSQEDNTLYINSKEDLYDSGGRSNKELFETVVDKLYPYFETENFCLIDNAKGIKILAEYNYRDKRHYITYNDIENFYEKTNGKDYVEVDNVKIADRTYIFIKDQYLDRLYIKKLYFSAIKDLLGKGVEKDNKYTDYLDGTVSVRLAPNNVVKNIVFKKGYPGSFITDNITINSTLEEVYSKYSTPAFGSVEKGFLGYLNSDFYIFYYNDEISVYPYSYTDNSVFEDILSKYIEDNDLEKFITSITNKLMNYDYLEYNIENGTAYLIFVNKGIEINIKNNSSKEITLYNNYHYTNNTKKYIKNGLISLNSNDDLVNITEFKRRNNTLNFE